MSAYNSGSITNVINDGTEIKTYFNHLKSEYYTKIQKINTTRYVRYNTFETARQTHINIVGEKKKRAHEPGIYIEMKTIE